jgi:hypothetical protein
MTTPRLSGAILATDLIGQFRWRGNYAIRFTSTPGDDLAG